MSATNEIRRLLSEARTHLDDGFGLAASSFLCRAICLSQGPDLAPLRAEAVSLLGKVAPSIEDETIAYPALDLLIERSPERLRVVRGLATRALERQSTDTRSLDLFTEAIQGSVLDAATEDQLMRFLMNVLRVRRRSGLSEVTHLRAPLERLHAARPHVPFARLFLARIYYLEYRCGKAASLLAGITGSLARNPQVLNLRGFLARRQGDLSLASSLLRASLEAKPQQPAIKKMLDKLEASSATRRSATPPLEPREASGEGF